MTVVWDRASPVVDVSLESRPPASRHHSCGIQQLAASPNRSSGRSPTSRSDRATSPTNNPTPRCNRRHHRKPSCHTHTDRSRRPCRRAATPGPPRAVGTRNRCCPDRSSHNPAGRRNPGARSSGQLQRPRPAGLCVRSSYLQALTAPCLRAGSGVRLSDRGVGFPLPERPPCSFPDALR